MKVIDINDNGYMVVVAGRVPPRGLALRPLGPQSWQRRGPTPPQGHAPPSQEQTGQPDGRQPRARSHCAGALAVACACNVSNAIFVLICYIHRIYIDYN